MYIFLSILIAIIALLLILVVVIQESKGGGLAAGFSSSNSIMGVQRTTNAIEKITWGLAATMAILCILCARWAPSSHRGAAATETSVISDYVDQATIPAPADAQPFGDVPATPAEPATPVEETPAE